MASPTTHPPIPRQPIGATFLVAISLLGVIAILQLCAVGWHYSKLVQQQMVAAATEAREETIAAPPIPTPEPVAASAGDPAELLRAQQLFVDADRHFRVGEFEKSLAILDEVDAVMPGDPSVSLRKAEILEKLDRPAEAVVALEEALNVPALPPNIRAQAEKKMALLAQRIGTGGRTDSASATDQTAVVDANRDAMRDPIGLQPGADLGIVDTRLQDGASGMKRLRVGVKSRPGVEIKVPDVRIYIYFYEETETGEIVITDSRVKTEWLSPPVNWAADEPELLLGQYILPESGMPGSSTANGAPGRKYHGYIVAVYYHQDLQDFRSEPATLAKEFPVPLYLKE